MEWRWKETKSKRWLKLLESYQNEPLSRIQRNGKSQVGACDYEFWCRFLRHLNGKGRLPFYNVPFIQQKAIWCPLIDYRNQETRWVDLFGLQRIEVCEQKIVLHYYDAESLALFVEVRVIKQSLQKVAFFLQGKAELFPYFSKDPKWWQRYNPVLYKVMKGELKLRGNKEQLKNLKKKLNYAYLYDFLITEMHKASAEEYDHLYEIYRNLQQQIQMMVD